MDFLSSMDADSIEISIRVLIQIMLLTMSAFFSGSETALFSLTRLDMQKLRNTRHPKSDSLHALLDEPRRLIISILCGNELVNIASSANMAAMLLILVGEADAGWVNMIVMVPMLLLFGEVTPKTIAVTFPTKFSANISAPLLPYWIRLIRPLRYAVRAIADRVTTFIVGDPEGQSNLLDPDEFRTLVEEGEASGALDATERILIDNLISASSTEVVTIMTPRTRMHYLSTDDNVEAVIARVREMEHPRIPIAYGNRLDHIAGFVHSEDLVELVHSDSDLSKVRLTELLRPANAVPQTKLVDEMFDYLREHDTRGALVISEDGSISGIITIKDVLSFIFGGLSSDMQLLEKFKTNSAGDCFFLPADMRLMDFSYLTNIEISDPRMTTIGGYALRLFGRVPKEGDKVSGNGISFKVTEMDGYRIQSLEVKLKSDPDEEEEENADGEKKSGVLVVSDTPDQAEDAAEAEEGTESDTSDSDVSPDGEKQSEGEPEAADTETDAKDGEPSKAS
ncbi:MAG: HlyC/CorC family transporter [Magnetococcales bacterium]|nr:HlyC/CorC family transporter [Magnetococcales bacterium]